ncbi:MAG TPA: hypothetical protein VK850_03670, partial [Candidatus Binatia bacterium]|nr:hypothetical protein [Candidatus Binatia bacterium]
MIFDWSATVSVAALEELQARRLRSSQRAKGAATMTLNIISLILFEASEVMTPQNIIAALYVFALAAFLGYQVISRV